MDARRQPGEGSGARVSPKTIHSVVFLFWFVLFFLKGGSAF